MTADQKEVISGEGGVTRVPPFKPQYGLRYPPLSTGLGTRYGSVLLGNYLKDSDEIWNCGCSLNFGSYLLNMKGFI
jgi:hypothetical protein